MTDYIIDPAVFYWINVLSIIQTVCAVIGGTCLLSFICFLIWYVCTIDGVDKPEKPDDDSRYAKESYERDMKRTMTKAVMILSSARSAKNGHTLNSILIAVYWICLEN